MSIAPESTNAMSLLAALATRPRGAGGDAERAARAACAERLRDAGFSVREVPFQYSALPGRWATPLAGLLLLPTIAVAGHMGYNAAPLASLLALLAGLAVIGAFAWWSLRRGVLDAPLLRRTATNLAATRADGIAPRVWLVAHLDSKSQPVPIGVRAAAIMLAGAACLALGAMAIAALGGARWAGGGSPGWQALTMLGWAAALPIIATTVGDRSPGALDNASGVVSVVLAAGALSPDARVGVLLTSAEELGLAGARAWARTQGPSIALNCDGVDDTGALTVLRASGGEAASGALASAARDEGAPVRIRALVPGVLVDAVALADAGWCAATLSRGTARSLLRIHRPADRVERLRGDGMVEAARVLARAAAALARG